VSVEIFRLAPEDLDGLVGELADVYREAFGASPYFEGEAEPPIVSQARGGLRGCG
jgi:hypothetical protein